MLTNRAMEILQAPVVIDVTHQNHIVWIESINEQEHTAKVKELKTNHVDVVPVAELHEVTH